MVPKTTKRTVASLLVATMLSTAAVPAMAQEIDVMELTIADIQAAYAAGEYTAEELTQAFLDRIAIYEPSYNAFTFMNEAALEEARAIDAARAAGEPLGPLAGVPIVIKEAVDVAGFPSTAGWAPLSSLAGGIDLIPGVDAPVVAQLRAAGAIILGKTNIPVFSAAGDANNSWAGPTYNAVNRELSPGGSSAGTATAVSGNFAVAGLGEETRGSLQIPAHFQSVVAVKPTFGLVPNTGVTPLGGSTTDVIGPMARTVTDAATMLDVMAGYTIFDPKTISSVGHVPEGGYTSLLSDTALEGARIGLFGPGFEEIELSEETAALWEAAIAELEAEGATTIADAFAGSDLQALGANPGGMESMTYDFDQYIRRMGPDAIAHNIEELVALLPPEELESGFPARLAADPTAPDMTDFIALREAYLDTFAAVMEANDLDVLVFPVDANGVPELGGPGRVTITVPEINISGLPGVIIPAGEYANGMPFSLIFIGPMWSEAELLAYAYDYEQATHHRIVPELEVVE